MRDATVGNGGTSEATAAAGHLRAWAGLVGVLVGALLVHGAIQSAIPGFVDRDAWFHSRYAELIGRGEIPWQGTTFPWITQSAYAENPMDWSLLWHLLVAPFVVALGAVTGMKVFAATQAALLTTTFFAVLRAQGVRAPLWWTVLLVASSPEWLYRLHFARPTPFVVLSLLILFHLVLRRRDVLAAVVVAGSLLLYHVPAPVVLVGGIAWIGRSVDERRPAWRAAGLLFGGAAAGLLLQPGLWSGGTFHVWGLMAGSLDVAASGGAVELSNGGVLGLALPGELGSPGVSGMVRELWQPLLATFVALGAGWPRRKQGPVLAGMLLAAAGLAATWRSGRFFEYWHVLAFLGAAVAVSGPSARGAPRWHARRVGGVALVLAALTVRSLPPLLARGEDEGAKLAPALLAVNERAAPGDVVWHSSWDDFAPLFHFAPHLRFVQGMDPWWCVVHDPEGALAHAMIAEAAVGGDALRELLVARFHARFVVLWSQPEDGQDGQIRRQRLAARLDVVPWATRIHRDETATVYELTRP